MPVLFITVGLVMFISSLRGTQNDLITLVKSDFSGHNNFIYFVAALFIIGSLGYIPMLKTASRYLLGLVIIVIILKNGGVWNQFVNALNGANTTQSNTGATNGA